MPAFAMPPQVVCLGECLIDRIFYHYHEHQFDVSYWEDYPGGAPVDVAAGLVKLGTSAGFIGSVGQDVYGNMPAFPVNGKDTTGTVWCI